MSDRLVARRYASALHDAATQIGEVEDVDADIDLIRSSLEMSRELVLFFESPIISRGKKAVVVRRLFADRLRPITLRFMELLVVKRRETIFPAVVLAYHALRDEVLGVTRATVRSARPLSETDEQMVVGTLKELSGRRIRLETETDDALIGGLVVRIGDTVYDGSVRNKLDALRDQFASRYSTGSLPAE